MWGSFLIKKDNCKNLTKWILLAHHVQRLTCILQDLWKLSKVGIYFETSHDAFKSYSCHWVLWLLGYRFHGSISSIIWFFFFFLIKCKKYIISKRARQACNTSWEPAENQKMYKRTIREWHPQWNRNWKSAKYKLKTEKRKNELPRTYKASYMQESHPKNQKPLALSDDRGRNNTTADGAQSQTEQTKQKKAKGMPPSDERDMPSRGQQTKKQQYCHHLTNQEQTHTIKAGITK